MFTFTHEQFSGPLDLLLQTIEEEHLKITDISLVAVTDTYIAHLESTGTIDEGEMADFLIIAAKLLYLKSKELLPQLALDEETAVDLARQLKMYELFARQAEVIKDLLQRRRFMYSREPIVIRATGFQPPKMLSAHKLAIVMQDLALRYRPRKLDEVQVEKVMSIKEKIDAVKDMLTTLKRATFKDFIADASSRADVIVTFLALLELVKVQGVHLEQHDHFDHIHIRIKEPVL